MQLADITASLEDVAAALGREPDWLARNWRRLHRDHGFPRALPGSTLRWSRAALAAWIEASGAPPAEATDPDSFIARARARLHRQLEIGP